MKVSARTCYWVAGVAVFAVQWALLGDFGETWRGFGVMMGSLAACVIASMDTRHEMRERQDRSLRRYSMRDD